MFTIVRLFERMLGMCLSKLSHEGQQFPVKFSGTLKIVMSNIIILELSFKARNKSNKISCQVTVGLGG